MGSLLCIIDLGNLGMCACPQGLICFLLEDTGKLPSEMYVDVKVTVL